MSGAGWVVSLARPAGALWRGVAGLRNALYARGLLRTERAGVPVVAIGNLAFGGTGKTPATLWLAGRLGVAGERVGIVSRGYGGVRREDPLVVARGGSLLHGPDEAGDEPVLLARASGAHVVVVGRDRVAAARRAAEEGAGVVLLDDGFQHRRLGRDLDVVLVDHAGAAGGIPRQLVDFLREPAAGLARAGIVLVTHAPAELLADPAPLPEAAWPPLVRDALAGVPPSARPLVAAAAHRADSLRGPGGTRAAAAALAGRRVVAVSGIARPERFAALLAGHGAVLASHLAFPDHHRFDAADAAAIAAAARVAGGGAWVVTTAKDEVRWPAGAPVPWVLDLALEIPAGDALLARVRERIGSARS